MTKADLIESVAAKLDLPKGQAERAVNLVFEDIIRRCETATR
jgi:nucleoid DNA-binding protein